MEVKRVAEANPLKQGLKHEVNPTGKAWAYVAEANPLKQGLKLPNCKHPTSYLSLQRLIH